MIDKDWLDKVALAASVYCEKPDVNEEEIDRFIEYLFKVYGYEQLMKIRGRK
jgi:hypothetical protein